MNVRYRATSPLKIYCRGSVEELSVLGEEGQLPVVVCGAGWHYGRSGLCIGLKLELVLAAAKAG